MDQLFFALSDSTRRDILSRVSARRLNIGEIAEHYDLKFGTISKHIKVLEAARLITKRRYGKTQVVSIVPSTIAVAREHIDRYAAIWAERFEQLDEVLKKERRNE